MYGFGILCWEVLLRKNQSLLLILSFSSSDPSSSPHSLLSIPTPHPLLPSSPTLFPSSPLLLFLFSSSSPSISVYSSPSLLFSSSPLLLFDCSSLPLLSVLFSSHYLLIILSLVLALNFFAVFRRLLLITDLNYIKPNYFYICQTKLILLVELQFRVFYSERTRQIMNSSEKSYYHS